MRKTPPVAKQVIPPFNPTNALIQARLIDFDTGRAELEEQHKTFLLQAMGRAKPNSGFHIRIFGFASHLGDAKKNEKLSLARMEFQLQRPKFSGWRRGQRYDWSIDQAMNKNDRTPIKPRG